MHIRVWKFRPPQESEAAFARTYSGDGPWAELFGRARGYRGSSLLRPGEQGGWWMTIDRWDSVSDFESFGRDYGEQYRALDAELEGIAGEEEFVGAFEENE
jgi:hypothetical protein